jgi:gliding motility-associated-like protein
VVATGPNACPSLPGTFAVSVTNGPAATITYAGTPYCAAGTASVTHTGTTGGTYSSTLGLSINSSNGTIDLAASTPGTYTVTYSFTSGSCSGAATATVTINALPTVAATEGNSTLNAGATTTYTNTTVGGTWSSSNTAVATVNSSTGVVTGVAQGTATITYTVSSVGCTASAAKTITINAAVPGNTAPVTVADTYSVLKGGTLNVPAPGVLTNDTDANSNTLTAVKVSNPANGTLTFNSIGSFTYVHGGGNNTSDSFSYKANDGITDGNTVTVSITVTATNTAPVTVADSYAVTRGGTLTQAAPGVLANDTDAESNTLSAVKVLDPANGTLTFNSNGSFTYQHNGSNTTGDSFTYKANDGTADGNTVTVNIVISSANNPPVAQNDTYTVTHNGITTVSAPGVLGNDTDLNSDPLTAIKVSNPAYGTLTFNSNGSFTYANTGGSATSDSFTYKVNDGKVDGNTVTVTLNIVRPNQAPVAVADSYNLIRGSTLAVSVPGVLSNDSDSDGNTITAIKISNPSQGTLTFNSNGSFTYVHGGGTNDSDSFAYKVNDGTVDGNIVTVTLTIALPGAAPVIADINKTIFKNQTYTFAAINFTEKFVDLLHDLQKVKIVTLPSSGILKLGGVNVTAGQEIISADLANLSFTPGPDFTGTVSFQYNASCLVGYALAGKNVNITVVEPGIPPVAVADTYTTTRGGTLTIAAPGLLANDTDADGHPLTAIKVSNPSHGSLTLNANGSFTYVHNNGTFTNDSFTYKVNDGYNDSNVATVNISTPLVNIPPVVSNVYITSNSASQIVFNRVDFAAKFADTDTISKIKIVSLPPVGILRVNGILAFAGQELVKFPNVVTFEPPLHWNGTTSFLWNASDGTQYAANDAQVIITVNQPSDPGAKIGLAKQLASTKPNVNGTYDLKFIFTVANFGTNDLDKVSVKDNLALAFNGAEFRVKSVTATGNLRANTGFTGISDTELLLNSSKLVGAEEAKIELDVNVKLLLAGGTFSNSAAAEGTSHITGYKVNDVSTNGLKPDPLQTGDVSPAERTQIKLDLLPSYVPQGFSPNGDGINDKFVVQNADGKHVSLEMYNRWGNPVYKSIDYKNDWGGEVTEGFFLGSGIPDGTYYYIIIIDKKDKYVGFITVNR